MAMGMRRNEWDLCYSSRRGSGYKYAEGSMLKISSGSVVCRSSPFIILLFLSLECSYSALITITLG